MSVDRSDLHRLVDGLPDDQVASAAEELRRRTRLHHAHSHQPFSWMAMGPSKHTGTDDARRIDEILAEELGRADLVRPRHADSLILLPERLG